MSRDHSQLQGQLRRTVLSMLAVGLVVLSWSAMTSGYTAPAASPADPAPNADATARPSVGARSGELLAFAQAQLAVAATTTTPSASPPTADSPEASSAFLALSAPATTIEPSTTTTAPPTTTTAAPTTTTTAPSTTTTTAPTTTTTAAPTTTTTVAPTTTTTVVSVPPSPGRLSEEEAIALFSIYFEPEDVETALRVAECESNLDPSAWNPNGYGGLFQHAYSAWDARAEAAGWAGADIFDAEANTAVSAWLVYEDGWWHWSCY